MAKAAEAALGPAALASCLPRLPNPGDARGVATFAQWGRLWSFQEGDSKALCLCLSTCPSPPKRDRGDHVWARALHPGALREERMTHLLARCLSRNLLSAGSGEAVTQVLVVHSGTQRVIPSPRGQALGSSPPGRATPTPPATSLKSFGAPGSQLAGVLLPRD